MSESVKFTPGRGDGDTWDKSDLDYPDLGHLVYMSAHPGEDESPLGGWVRPEVRALVLAAPDLLEWANEVLEHFMPQFNDSRAVDDCLVGLAAAVMKAENGNGK